MVIRSASIEVARSRPKALIVGLHPGTVDTALSTPFQAGVPEGRLFTPERSARAMLSVVDGLDAAASGRLFAWDGREIQP